MASIIFLHGLSASARFFDPLRAELATRGYADTYAFDLLGFGSRRYEGKTYDLREHLDHISREIDGRAGTEAFHLVGHSMGGILAVAWASEHPERIKSITLLTTPLGETEDDMVRGIRTMEHGWAPIILKHPHLSHLSCTLLCQLHAMYLFEPMKPAWVSRELFRDYTRHTWHSLSASLRNIVLGTPALPMMRSLMTRGMPLCAITASDDSPLCRTSLTGTTARHVEFHGTHYLPLQSPSDIAGSLKEWYDHIESEK